MGEPSIPSVFESEGAVEPENFQELKRLVTHAIGRGVLAVTLMLGAGTAVAASEAVINATSHPVLAASDNYPDKDAVSCGNGIWCKDGTWRSARGYAYRNCTDWAAWRIPQITGKIDSSLGNGGDWDANASSSAEVDNVPEVGDAAVFDYPLYAGDIYGHVAVVEEVRKDADGKHSARVSEYNYGTPGKFRQDRWVRADHYVDFTPDINEGKTESQDSRDEKRSDFNGSGRSDALLYQAGTGPDSVFYGRANKGSFGDYNISLDREYQIATADFNNDGEGDFFAYGQGTEPDYIFYGQPQAADFHKYGISIDGNYDQIVPGDFDGDGFGDIMLYAQNGTDKVMYGTKTAANFVYTTPGIQLDQQYKITSGKYNDDTRSDIFLYNETGTDYVLVGRQGRGDFGKYSLNPQIDLSYERPVSGDFNGDGRDDVLLYGQGDYVDRIFYGRSAAGEFGKYGTTISRTYTPIATGDYNGDGYDDVIMNGPGDNPDRVLYGTKNEGALDPVAITLRGSYRRIST